MRGSGWGVGMDRTHTKKVTVPMSGKRESAELPTYAWGMIWSALRAPSPLPGAPWTRRLLPGLALAACLPLCLAVGPSGCAAEAVPPPASTALPFDAQRAWAHLESYVALGARPSGSSALAKHRDQLVAGLEALGLEPVREPFTDRTPIGDIAFENVYADLVAAPAADGTPAPMVVLLSHIDTKRMPGYAFLGANDGGSSTAALMELARCLTGASAPSKVTWRFLFVDGEEPVGPNWVDPDNRYGSRYHVKHLVETGAIDHVAACVVLDLVADPDLAFELDTNSDRELLRIFLDAAKAEGLEKHFQRNWREIRDDHLSFIQANVPAIDLIDLQYGPNNRWWHSREDTLENCSAASLGIAGRIVLAGLPGVEEWATR